MTKMSKSNKTLMAVSTGFISLMLAVSMVLYLGNDDTARVESQNAQVGDSYSLENLDELEVKDVGVPMSKVDMEEIDADLLELQIAGIDEMATADQVPEPATLSLLLVGGLGLVSRYRRRRG